VEPEVYDYLKEQHMALNRLTENLKDKVAGAGGYLSDLKEEGKEKFLNYLNGLGEILPLIAEAGYTLDSFDVDVSLPPGISMKFEKVLDVSRVKIDSILEQNKDKDLLKMIVTSLVAADEFHKKIKLGSFLLTHITVDLSVPPRMKISFVKKG
jgi:hypothetical protein